MMNLQKQALGWAEHALASPELPLADFHGDETITVPYAAAATNDPKEMGLPWITVRGVLTVASQYGARIDPETFERVKRMAIAPEAADVYLDEPGQSGTERRRRHTIVAAATEYALSADVNAVPSDQSNELQAEQPLLFGSLEYWGNSVRTLPEDVRGHIEGHALGCIALSLEKSNAEDFASYARVAAEESRQYGQMWADTVWAGQADRLPLNDIHAWMGEFVSNVALFGAAFDLKRDHQNGLLAFQPKPVAHGLMLVGKSLSSLPAIAPEVIGWKKRRLMRNLPKRFKSVVG